jgi:hypothetical protein
MTNFARIALLSLPLVVAACGKKDKDAPAGDKAGKAAEGTGAAPKADDKPLELTDTLELQKGISDPDEKRFEGFKVKAPTGAKVESGLTGVTIRIGERQAYEIGFAFEPGFVAKEKGKANADTLDKVVKFHVDTPEAILWESKSELGGENNFSFAAEIKVGDKTLKCFNKGYGNFTKNQADALLKSCQSVAK